MSVGGFASWFHQITGHASPHDWQKQLVEAEHCRNRVIRIGTGLGKTEGVLAAWIWHSLEHNGSLWPRRLVWCLPMRVLVEQTEHTARTIAATLAPQTRPDVFVAMGGQDAGEWFLFPERRAIIIGTQDMLLSRALNRGYASPRARWPVEFGLLSHDALWVMDEVQLMDVGLATSAQLQAFREQDASKGFRPCYTWWMSATLQPDWLKSVDTAEHHDAWVRDPTTIPPDRRTGGLWAVRKALTTAMIDGDDSEAFARRILDEHAATEIGEFGRITLVVCNTVDRACDTFDSLQAAGRVDGIELVHSRFRPAERDGWRDRFLSRAACTPDADRIIVATQVVEAGVDISAGCLITELAPWPSLVQRFGRCSRYGGSGRVIVVDRGRDEKAAMPYAAEELNSAWDSLQDLPDAGLATLDSFEESLPGETRSRLYPYAPSHLLLRREFDELFDTTPDLTGADLDISRFIRSGEERDLQVFWIDLESSQSPAADRRPHRRELCAVPFGKARSWLCGEETKSNRKPKLRAGMRAWVWDWLDGQWVTANRASLLPGRIVCVAAACGGYRPDRGFDPESRDAVAAAPPPTLGKEAQALDQSDNQQDDESLSVNQWKTIGCHGSEVARAARDIAEAIALPAELQHVLELAGRWHDLGKSHPAFQGAMRGADRPLRLDLAKGPDNAWMRPFGTYRFLDDTETRPAFRHELASALALFAVLETYAPQHPALLGPWVEAFAEIGNPGTPVEPLSPPPTIVQPILDCSAPAFDLLAYLIASHHGKVRVGLHAAPKDQEYRDRDGRGLPIRGVREGDCLPAVTFDAGMPPSPALSLTLEPAAIGLSKHTGASWRERCLGLLERYGPAALAYLEALLRAADVRASRLNTSDPAFTEESAA
ncbi:MAG: CRISPR-associated endonuclease Cas3'' [Candidatus Anammoximicrobium sp.]|nr:CRISPR-associated endonuclease Cas3'' [Candidatus Anammoximicrobium sp.]